MKFSFVEEDPSPYVYFRYILLCSSFLFVIFECFLFIIAKEKSQRFKNYWAFYYIEADNKKMFEAVRH